jgi:hypothetical protein
MKKNIKQYLSLILLGIALDIGFLNANERPLKHRTLVMIDGVLVDCVNIGYMVHCIKDIFKRQFGTRQGNSTSRAGFYIFRDRLYSIHSLADIEHDAVERQDEALMQDLAAHLILFKEEFVKAMESLLERLRKLPQRAAHELMKEWADLHDRHDSIIFEWCKHKVGNEEEIFNTHVDSFAKFDQFCIDVASFLDDLIKSCPKGYQQYLDAIHQQK